jgi:hypothetical protein
MARAGLLAKRRLKFSQRYRCAPSAARSAPPIDIMILLACSAVLKNETTVPAIAV